MKILACDPGTFESGYVIFDGVRVIYSDIVKNEVMLDVMFLATQDKTIELCAIEMVEARGMPVGKETFETVYWTGRFFQQWAGFTERPCERVYRRDVKMHLTGSTRAKDSNIRVALIDKLGPVGTKSSPGPLYGVKSHCWAALAVGVCALQL